jgi:hypothetical protein
MTSRWQITAYILCIFTYKLKFVPLLDWILKRYLKKGVRKNEWSVLGLPMSPIGGMFSQRQSIQFPSLFSSFLSTCSTLNKVLWIYSRIMKSVLVISTPSVFQNVPATSFVSFISLHLAPSIRLGRQVRQLITAAVILHLPVVSLFQTNCSDGQTPDGKMWAA